MDDLISRQAAIDFIDAGHLVNPNEPRWSDNEVVNFLKSRPSAQPEPCEDTVSRAKAIDEIKEIYEWHDNVTKERIIEHFKQLPPAQPSTGDCWGCNCPKMERLAQPEPSQVAKDIARIVENWQDMRVIAQPEIIYCKDCKKQNRHYHQSPYKDTVCPLTAWRGTAQGHEYDYQFCCFAERIEVTT